MDSLPDIAVRQLDAVTPRIETGPTRFGNDWCGLFIRGDNAFNYAYYLERALETVVDPILKSSLSGLLEDLRSCYERPNRIT